MLFKAWNCVSKLLDHFLNLSQGICLIMSQTCRHSDVWHTVHSIESLTATRVRVNGPSEVTEHLTQRFEISKWIYSTTQVLSIVIVAICEQFFVLVVQLLFEASLTISALVNFSQKWRLREKYLSKIQFSCNRNKNGTNILYLDCLQKW